MVWGGGVLGEDLGVLDFAGGKQQTGSRFAGQGEAKLTKTSRDTCTRLLGRDRECPEHLPLVPPFPL
jgi:hypothetical protein